MNHEQEEKFEQHICFVAEYYSEGTLDEERAWKQFAAEHAIRKQLPLRHFVAAIAAVMVILIGLGTIYLINRNASEWVIINTLDGQNKDVFLPDSSLISLAENSEIRYDLKDYNRKRRAVEMKGRAFFQVVQDKARPFSVKTHHTLTTVVGTSFQIEEQKEATRINVAMGRVLFESHKKGDKNLLISRMSAEYIYKNHQMSILIDDVDTNYLSWKTHTLTFLETPLEKVIEDLNKYFKVLIINKSSNKDLKLTATFKELSLDETLSIINQTLDTQLVIVSGQ